MKAGLQRAILKLNDYTQKEALLHVSSYEHALSDVEDILHANGVTDMAAKSNTIPDKQKNYCAISLMKSMLIKYAQRNNLSFEDAMFDFVKSSTYEALFDYDVNGR